MSVEGENEETNPSFLCELESTEEEEIVAHRWWWRWWWCCCCWWCCCWCWADGSKLGWDEELVDRMPLGGNWNLLLLSSLGVFVKNRPVLKSVKVLIGELQRTHNKYNGVELGYTQNFFETVHSQITNECSELCEWRTHANAGPIVKFNHLLSLKYYIEGILKYMREY